MRADSAIKEQGLFPHNKLKAAPHEGGVFEFLHALNLGICSLLFAICTSLSSNGHPVQLQRSSMCCVTCHVMLCYPGFEFIQAVKL